MAGKKKSRKSKKKPSPEQSLALNYVHNWISNLKSPSPPPSNDFLPSYSPSHAEPPVFELHCHSNHSDGSLSPAALVQRAHRNGVKVLALTDHDTFAGIPEAMEVAQRYGIKIIPGVEISSVYSPRKEAGTGENVHILAYYSSCGPSRYEDVEKMLSTIRDGRFIRAKDMILKLSQLKAPVKWEHVTKIAGEGVAPGRVHIAQALVEAGHVNNPREAFNRYIHDGGPAYASGYEPYADEVVQLICDSGGIAALAHPWSLKNPVSVIKSLKASGLHAMEVYRSDGKVAGFDELADAYGLIKLGGSDYHARGGHNESDVGSVKLAITTLHGFLKIARPIWCKALKDILRSFVDDPSDSNVEKLTRFRLQKKFDGCLDIKCDKDIVGLYLNSTLAEDEKDDEFEAIRLKFEDIFVRNGSL